MPIKSLFGKTYQVIERSLEIGKVRHGLIASNVANVDTAGYKAGEIDFDKALKDALEKRRVGLTQTHPRHFGIPGLGAGNYEISHAEQSWVDIDREMSKLAENNLRYQTSIEVLLRKFSALKHTIAEGGR
ncbi:MAG: flagellar basal body rod protein FlgB [Deltaproteobacteria bacterium]|nr:flagellar basal body rod protein FlgB [Deltaproteobacteria bacterium]